MQDLQELLDLTAAGVWEGLRGKRLFLTGGTGFVGKWLLEALLFANQRLALGLHVTVLTRQPQAFVAQHPHLALAPGVTLWQGDVVDCDGPAMRCDLVVHAALPVLPLAMHSPDLMMVSQGGTARMAAWAVAMGAQRFLHISSGAVYGPQAAQVLALDEATAWDDSASANAYTLAKRAAEHVLNDRAWPFDWVIARCFAFIGPYQSENQGTAAAQLLSAAARNQSLVLSGTGQAVRSYQYASDMARWLLVMLVHGRAGEAYNVGHDTPWRLVDVAHQIAQTAQPALGVSTLGQPSSGLAGERYLPSLRKARDQLRLLNAVDLPIGIQRTLDWLGTPCLQPVSNQP